MSRPVEAPRKRPFLGNLPPYETLLKAREQHDREIPLGEGAAETVAKLTPGPLGLAADFLLTAPSIIMSPLVAARWIHLQRHPNVKVPFNDVLNKGLDIVLRDDQMQNRIEKWRVNTKTSLLQRVRRNIDRQVISERTMKWVYPGAAALRLAVEGLAQIPDAHAFIAQLPLIGELASQSIGTTAVEILGFLAVSELGALLNYGLRRTNTEILINKFNQVDGIAASHRYTTDPIKVGRQIAEKGVGVAKGVWHDIFGR